MARGDRFGSQDGCFVSEREGAGEQGTVLC